MLHGLRHRTNERRGDSRFALEPKLTANATHVFTRSKERPAPRESRPEGASSREPRQYHGRPQTGRYGLFVLPCSAHKEQAPYLLGSDITYQFLVLDSWHPGRITGEISVSMGKTF